MSRSTLSLTPELADYLRAHSRLLDPLEQRLVDETAALGPISRMQISPEQGVFLRLLVAITGSKRVLEIGTFTGFSSLMMARGGAERVLCLDSRKEWTAIARRYWKEAGVEDRIELKIGPAIETLGGLDPDERFDFAFIDADKESYPSYFEMVLDRLEPGGLVAVDNTLWSGRVIDPTDQSEDTKAIRRFNALAAADHRVEVLIVPIGDGLSLIRKV